MGTCSCCLQDNSLHVHPGKGEHWAKGRVETEGPHPVYSLHIWAGADADGEDTSESVLQLLFILP